MRVLVVVALAGTLLAQGRKSRFDPPPDIPHLESTDAELRRRIDDLVATMMDVTKGRDSLRARGELVKIGKPAFPRILAAMARVRDSITDVDSREERLVESSLKLADEALRQMDGWLDGKEKSTLRPGSERKYITYICRLHYKRWIQVLKDMDELPGPFDGSSRDEIEDALCWLSRDQRVVQRWASTYTYRRNSNGERELVRESSSVRRIDAAKALEAVFKADQLPKQVWPLLEKVPKRIDKERAWYVEYGALIPGLDYQDPRIAMRKFAAVLLAGLEHGDPRLRTLARDCLRRLFATSVGFEPRADAKRRAEQVKRWREAVVAAMN